MSIFDTAFVYLMDNEDKTRSGKVTSEPSGGVAKWGINSKAHPNVDVANLTLEQAQDIYRDEYWQLFGIYRLTVPRIAIKLFDTVVNCGPKAIHWLQQAIGMPQEQCDGAIGPKTIEAVSKANVESALMQFVNLQSEFYQERATKVANYPLESLLIRARKLPR